MSAGEVVLEARQLTIRSRLGPVGRTIVSGIDLTVAAGETIGIVGESGSGKSMTARALLNLLPAGVQASGSVQYRGRELLNLSERAMRPLRGSELGAVFQDPFTMLSPVRRCGRHVDELLRRDGGGRLSRRERRAEAVRRLAEVGIDDARVVDRYPFELSGGMRQRVGIASALARDPRLLIADEPSTALDVTTQREILALLKSLQRTRNMALIMITHDLRVAFATCDRVYVLYAGSVLEVSPARALEEEPLHPYTLGLLLSEPPGDRRLASLPAIPGSVAAPDSVAGECPFAPRCSWVADACRAAPTRLQTITPSRASACLRVGDIRTEMEAARVRASAGAGVGRLARTGVAQSLVSARDVRKVFASGVDEVVALGGVSVEVEPGESVGLVGESGSGKTTFGRCVVGLERPTSGSLRVGGVDVSDLRRLSRAERQRFSRTAQIVFQDPYSSLNPVRTIGAAMREVLLTVDPARRRLDQAAADLLTRVGLPADYLRRKPIALSGGERQRVAIARVLAVEPKLLICDEPVSALDVSVQAQVLNLFTELREELDMTYLFITHDLAVVRQVVERVYVLYRGTVVEQGEVERVLDAPQAAYTRQLVESIPRADEDWLDAGVPVGAPASGGAT
ncbi:MAG TPA: ABC transporter ATP-binding protein [Gaiellaceae bacterium]|nr:ABC transporter ATP-binding protein [Gaiellaceae bacterium]